MKNEMRNILIVDDVADFAALIKYRLSKEGYNCIIKTTGRDAIEEVEKGFLGVIILDLWLPDYSGIELLEKFQSINSNLPVIIMTAYGNIDSAIESIKKGAYDFILKNDNVVERISIAVQNAFKNLELEEKLKQLSSKLEGGYSVHFASIITQSAKMKKVFELLRHVIDSNVTVLLQGESGTGKELIARAIHFSSSRKHEPFIAINCAGIPPTLLESELFGYEKGAFTGAYSRKIGKFEAADKGTIFLDEISEMDMNLQSKLLRVIQEREIEPLGSSKRKKIDVRIISATNKDLHEEVKKGNFREDLFYRLSVFPVTLPPLREREGDIPILVNHFLKKFSKLENKKIKGITKEVLEILESYHFPGNVRELENIIRRSVVICDGDMIKIEHLPSHLQKLKRTQTGEFRRLFNLNGRQSIEKLLRTVIRKEEDIPRLKDVERIIIKIALDICGGSIKKASELLGVSRPTIYNKLNLNS